MTAADVLGPAGPVARRLDRFEERPEQLRMADAVERAIREKRHLLVEAGTGVGKSFAYLVPAILRAAESRDKVVISTETISLQEQLLKKDVPFLSGILPAEFSVVLAKGRSNYLCRRRLAAVVAEERSFFDAKADVEELHRIAAWAAESKEGTLQDLPFIPRPEVWSRIAAEAGSCTARRCEQGGCPYWTARRRLLNANVIIANHALVFSDLGLRRHDAALLPEYSILVLDEAHEVEDAAAENLGLRVSAGGVRYLLGTLAGRSGKGLLAAAGASPTADAAVDRAKAAAERFFAAVGEWAVTRAPKNLRVDRPEIVGESPAGEFRKLAEILVDEADEAEERGSEVAPDLVVRASQIGELAEAIPRFLALSEESQVHWVDMEESGRRIELRSAPIRVGPLLSEMLFSEVPTVVLTSATLTVGRDRSFAYLKDRLGIEDADELALGSPFDFERLVEIRVPARMPDPREGAAYEEAVAREVVKSVVASEGRAFVLFTSYRMLENVHRRVAGEIEGRGFRVFRQGGGMPRTKLVEAFKEDVSSVLFGTDSFWQGVDVPGESLSHVIITKLPFDVPDRPLVEARAKEIEARGGSSFSAFSLPRAVLKLKQGFGRLVRTKEDRGIVTILDPRILTKPYGRLFLDYLPPCPLVRPA